MSGRSTVAEAMLAHPTLAGVDVTVGEMRSFLTGEHVHCGVIVSSGRRLRGVVLAGDLADAPDDAPALSYASLEGRTVAATQDAEEAREAMVTSGTRRLAVVGEDQALLGLLCLKRTGRGFCSAGDVAARFADRVPAYDAIVLAGGEARRMGGIDKTGLVIGDRSILGQVLDGLPSVEAIVVGPEVGGGPVAAAAAGLARADSALVVLLAGDMPYVAAAVPRLLDALVTAPDAEAAVLVADGRRQYLAAAWRRNALAARLHRLGDPEGAAMRRLYDGEIVEVDDLGGWSTDVDTPEDLRRARAHAAHMS